MLTLRETKQHYLRSEVRNTILRVSIDDNFSRSGHWQDTKEVNGKTEDIADWYRHVNGKKFKYDLSSPVDYTNMVLKHRTIYWTLNYFDKEIFKLDYSGISTNESPNISQKYTMGYSLGIDIDRGHGTNIHDPEVKKAVEDMGQFFSGFLREYLPNSVYCLYSGGGIYLLIHHRALQQYYDRHLNSTDPVYTWEYMFQVLGNAFDMLIEAKEEEFFKLHPEHVGKVKADALNNSQRVFKTIFSIHKSLPYAVIPLDPSDIKIDFEKATLPLKEDVLEDGLNWYTDFDDGGYFLVNCLMPYLEAAKKKKKAINYDSEYICSAVAIDDVNKWPPCMRNMLTLETREAGATRALAGFASFLGQIGLDEDKARGLFFGVANRWGTRTSNIFESYFRKMKTPICARLCSDDNTKFPKGVSIKKLGVCKPDQRCLNSPSPYYYVDKKAKLNWSDSKKPNKKSVKKEPIKLIESELDSDNHVYTLTKMENPAHKKINFPMMVCEVCPDFSICFHQEKEVCKFDGKKIKLVEEQATRDDTTKECEGLPYIFDGKFEYMADVSKLDEMIKLSDDAIKAINKIRVCMLESCGLKFDEKVTENMFFLCNRVDGAPVIAEICELAYLELCNQRQMLERIKEKDPELIKEIDETKKINKFWKAAQYKVIYEKTSLEE